MYITSKNQRLGITLSKFLLRKPIRSNHFFKEKNIINGLLHINFMKSYKLLLAILLLTAGIAINTDNPTWVINPNIDAGIFFWYSGEVVAVSLSVPSTHISTATTTTLQRPIKAYNKTNFAITPKVILSLIGYTQTPPALPTLPFGFRINIFNVNSLNFTYNITVYGSMVYALSYLYLAIQYDTNVFYTDMVTLTCNYNQN